MITKIILENFMSHTRTELELADGLTVLVGPNNCGKSAVVEAIRTVCENTGKDFLVRHGEKCCRVVIETDDGHDGQHDRHIVEWNRDKSVVSYTIDGREVHRLGGGLPDDLHEVLRLPLVSSPDGGSEFDIHIASQKSPLFLLDGSGRDRAMFFASSSDAALVMDMQRRHKQRVTERKRDEQQLIKQQQQHRDRLEALAPIEQVDDTLKRAESLYEQIGRAAVMTEKLAAETEQLRRHEGRLMQAREIAAAMQPLPAPPELADPRPLEKLLSDMLQAEREVLRGRERAARLQSLTAPPPLASAVALEALCRQLDAQSLAVAAGESRMRASQGLQEPPMLADTAELASLCAAMDRQAALHDQLKQQSLHLDPLRPPPEIDDAGKLTEILTQLRASQCSIHRLDARLKLSPDEPPELADPVPLSTLIESMLAASVSVRARLIEAEHAAAALSELSADLRDYVSLNPTCPVCGGVIDADDLVLDGGHAHA